MHLKSLRTLNMSANSVAFLVLVAAPSSTVPPVVPAGTVNIPRLGHIWKLLPSKNLIGREPTANATVVLPWAHVSRRQAEIEWFPTGGWEIEDLRSRNGTFVNGQRLQPRGLTPLQDGDRVGIANSGDIELLFCFRLDPAVTGPTHDGGGVEQPQRQKRDPNRGLAS